MAHHYKHYTIEQLEAEEEILNERLAQAIKNNQANHIAINTRKIEIVQSFMIDQHQFKVGDRLHLVDEPETIFEIDEMVGVIAWGYRLNPKTLQKIDPSDRIAKLLVLLGERYTE